MFYKNMKNILNYFKRNSNIKKGLISRIFYATLQ